MEIGNTQLVRPKKLAQELGISITTLWRMRRKKEIPQPIRLGSRMIAWQRIVINQWIEEKGCSF